MLASLNICILLSELSEFCPQNTLSSSLSIVPNRHTRILLYIIRDLPSPNYPKILIDCRTIQCCPKMLMNRSHNCLAGARPGKINFTLVKFTRIQQLWLVRKDWFLDYSKENLQLGASLNKQGNLQQVFWDARGDKKRRGLLHWGE